MLIQGLTEQLARALDGASGVELELADLKASSSTESLLLSQVATLVKQNRKLRHNALTRGDLLNDLQQIAATFEAIMSGKNIDKMPDLAMSDISNAILPYLYGIEELVQALKRSKRKLEKQTSVLRTAKDRAEAANNAKSTFLANTSHELRTPLTLIIGHTEMVLDDLEMMVDPDLFPSTVMNDLAIVQSQSRHLLQIINQVLDLSKIEAGKMEVFAEKFAVAPLVAEIAESVQPLAEQRRNKLEIETHEAPKTIFADRIKTKQILMNLIANACKFTEDGCIEVVCSTVYNRGFEYLGITIKDSGIGMSEDQLKAVFNAFQQADESTSRSFGGTGLGLHIVKQFCTLMGGDISVESELGVGSVFRVRLPVAWEFTEAPAPVNKISATTNENAKSVLVVDDEPNVVSLLAKLVQKEGYNVLTAYSAEEALVIAREKKPDFITLDILLQGVNGYSVLEKLQGDPELRHIPIIVITVLDDKKTAFDLGATEFFTKPFRSEEIARVLSKHLGSKDTVLIVDDDPATRELLTRIVEKHGLSAWHAQDGRDAIERLTERIPDFILLDLSMPEMDGLAFIEQLRRNEEWLSIPIAVLSGKTLTAEEVETLRGNGHQFIAKNDMEAPRFERELIGSLKQASTCAEREEAYAQ